MRPGEAIQAGVNFVKEHAGDVVIDAAIFTGAGLAAIGVVEAKTIETAGAWSYPTTTTSQPEHQCGCDTTTTVPETTTTCESTTTTVPETTTTYESTTTTVPETTTTTVPETTTSTTVPKKKPVPSTTTSTTTTPESTTTTTQPKKIVKSLPRTGVNSIHHLEEGLLVIGVGGAAVYYARKRSDAHAQKHQDAQDAAGY